jgi:predicted DNA-binding transcriptional regulator AlpA
LRDGLPASVTERGASHGLREMVAVASGVGPIMIEKRIVRKNEVLKRLGIRKTTLHETFIKTGRLRFVKIGVRAVGIIEDELDALIEELRRERDRRP